MIGKKGWIVIALAAMLSLAGTATAFADTPYGNGLAVGTVPTSGYVQLNSGQQQWYTFNSSQVSASATDAQITIQLAANPQGSVNFAVWTQEQLNAFNSGDTTLGAPVGRGTLQTRRDSNNTLDLYNGDLLWVGRSLGPTTYYVQVYPNPNGFTSATYALAVNGNYISFPNGTLAAQAARMMTGATGATQQASATSASSASSQAPLTLPSTGPSAKPAQGSTTDNALPLNGQQRTLGVGQQEWYTFQYPGHDADGNQPTANLVLMANPQGSATFTVWTAQRLQAAARGDTTFGVPVAKGSLHPTPDGANTVDRFGGNLEWAGKSPAAETYYVLVQQTGSVPTTYTLQFSLQ